MRYPESPGHKVGGTSEEAAVSMSERSITLRSRALRLLKKKSLTADQVARRLGESVLAIRPRISELHTMGLIIDSGRRRKNKSGRNAIVWEYDEL